MHKTEKGKNKSQPVRMHISFSSSKSDTAYALLKLQEAGHTRGRLIVRATLLYEMMQKTMSPAHFERLIENCSRAAADYYDAYNDAAYKIGDGLKNTLPTTPAQAPSKTAAGKKPARKPIQKASGTHAEEERKTESTSSIAEEDKANEEHFALYENDERYHHNLSKLLEGIDMFSPKM